MNTSSEIAVTVAYKKEGQIHKEFLGQSGDKENRSINLSFKKSNVGLADSKKRPCTDYSNEKKQIIDSNVKKLQERDAKEKSSESKTHEVPEEEKVCLISGKVVTPGGEEVEEEEKVQTA
jgi:hypothetical protein